MSLHDTLLLYLPTLLPPVRPTPAAEALARHPTVAAYLRLLGTHFLVDAARQVVSDVGHLVGCPTTSTRFTVACAWDAVRGAWVLRPDAPVHTHTVLHMGFAPAVTVAWLRP